MISLFEFVEWVASEVGTFLLWLAGNAIVGAVRAGGR